jgi:hypothetical protein
VVLPDYLLTTLSSLAAVEVVVVLEKVAEVVAAIVNLPRKVCLMGLRTL